MPGCFVSVFLNIGPNAVNPSRSPPTTTDRKRGVVTACCILPSYSHDAEVPLGVGWPIANRSRRSMAGKIEDARGNLSVDAVSAESRTRQPRHVVQFEKGGQA